MSFSDSSKSKISVFSIIREGVTDLTRGTKPYRYYLQRQANNVYHIGLTYLLQTPAEEDLTRRFVVFLAQFLQHWFSQPLTSCQRTVRFHDDIPLFEPADNIGSREPWVKLILPDVDLAARATVDVLFKLV